MKAYFLKYPALIYALLFCATIVKAQIESFPLTYDPLRYANRPSAMNSKNARVSNTGFRDTLELPFFEDFTQACAPIDTIFAKSGTAVSIKTLGHHGLKTGNKIFLKLYTPNSTALQGTYWANVLNKNEFQLATSSATANLLMSDGTPIIGDYAYWTKIGAKLGPNPDTLKWEDDGGAYISDRIAKQPPSLYVATFDALDANGKIYLASTGGAKTDFLVSQAINFSGMTADSNIVLSFYVQGGGNGSPPLSSDSIYLLLKDKNDKWNRVWGQKGKLPVFQKFAIKIIKSEYFHQSFQFRFQNYTAINGTVSTSYNVDYIYLDKNWNESKDFPLDAAINQRQTSILKKYSALPSFQYQPTDLADTVKFAVRNNSNQVTGLGFSHNFIYPDGSISPNDMIVTVGFPARQATIPAAWKVDPSLVTIPTTANAKDTLTIKYEVNALTGDKQAPNGIRFNMNNRDSSTVKLSNYYAYDDGSAEGTIRLVGPRRLLIKYTLNNVPDTITHIDIFNPNTRFSVQGGEYIVSRLLIADGSRKLIDNSTTDIALKYPVGRNVFSRYKLKNPYIATNKDFYIGFEQTNGLEVHYGKDVNNESSTVYIYDLRDRTKPPVESEFLLDGQIMIRPVLRINDIGVAVEQGLENNLICELFPNPAKNLLMIEGEVTTVDILHITGQVALQQKFAAEEDKKIDISSLPNGMYMVKLYNESQQSFKKLLIAK